MSNYSEADENVQLYNGHFINAREQKIYCYYWKPMVQPRALLLIITGFTEHSMVYDQWAREIARKGFFVFAHDHVGHGHSDGYRGYLESFDHVVEDSEIHVKSVRKEYPHLPLFVLGHSMGGSATIVLSAKDELEIKGVVLIGPALVANYQTVSYFWIELCKFIGIYLPHLPLIKMDFSLCCQDESNVKKMMEDPLRVNGYCKARTIASIAQGSEIVINLIPDFKVPFCILQGEADKICHVDGAKSFYEGARSSDKFLKIYPNSGHSLHFEPHGVDKDTLEQTIQWLTERI